ncbi:hypothetical protein CONLIGDRAFT_690142 [Coniochaeta ligniaria NRRL 30616]|uniref:Uncharacterized protein n=1 Tax=Coniochaeta ligniaria NRRL 30616 TaxID=1408157 RepID=A0A1J7J5Z5_9PEZI|nr:hypothetical protein CONLIGDRAFT_690142 [Coniochaeta ligniaria NRRL 30616]
MGLQSLLHYIGTSQLSMFNTAAGPQWRLHGREQSLCQGRTVPISKQGLIDIRRQAANDTHRDQSFLGDTNEIGLALRTSGWAPNKPCYLCYGMMGYQQAILRKAKDQNNYNATFN